MDQFDFFKQLSYINFLQKNTLFSSLKSVRVEYQGEGLGTLLLLLLFFFFELH